MNKDSEQPAHPYHQSLTPVQEDPRVMLWSSHTHIAMRPGLHPRIVVTTRDGIALSVLGPLAYFPNLAVSTHLG